MATTTACFFLSLLFERLFHIPQWAKLCVCFPNALSLPLLLVKSLEQTKIIDLLLWGPDDTVSAAVRRGRTYILVRSMEMRLR
jgi:auxin efflux carrier family protein